MWEMQTRMRFVWQLQRTISNELLEKIFSRHGIDAAQREAIKEYAASKRERIINILKTDVIEDEIPSLATEEFIKNPPVLELSGIFCETDISYSEEEYAMHLNDTKIFAEQNINYTVKESSAHAFRNIQILIHEGQWAMVSKGKAPAIHFVIRHPKLRSAIENFIPPVTEE